MMFTVGQVFEMETGVTSFDVETFAKVSEDYNPLHTDGRYAGKTMFKRCIAHGALVTARISALLGTRIVDTKKYYVVYVSQAFQFKRPIYAFSMLKIVGTVREWDEDKRFLTMDIAVINEEGKPVVVGESVVMIKELEAE